MGRAAIGDLTVSSSSIVLPNPAGPVLLHWHHDFIKVELLYSNALCTTKAKYIVFIKNPLLYSCVQNEIDGVQLYSCPSSVFVGSRGNGERCLFAESVRLRWVSGFPWYTYSCIYNVCCIKWTRRENEPCYVCWRLVHIFFHTLILMFTSMYCVRIQYRSPLYLVDLTSGSVLHLDSITTRA